jgi:NCK-associated protein 1
LGPKAVVVWSALSAAKAEVFWYFRHITAPPPKKDKFNEDALRDQHISELLHLINQVSALVRQHQRIMQAYYLEYLHEADRKALEDQIRTIPAHAPILPILKTILNDLQMISVDAFMAGTPALHLLASTTIFYADIALVVLLVVVVAAGTEYNFDSLRLNWARVEANLSVASSTILPSAVKELVHRGRIICLHTRNVDEIEEQIELHASLKALWYYRDSLIQVFDKSIIDGPANPLNCMAFLQLLSEFPENATGWLPAERESIGPQCVKLAEDMLGKITHRVASIVFEIGTGKSLLRICEHPALTCFVLAGKHNLTFNNQLNHVHGAHPLLARLKDYKFDKNYTPPTTPGTESQYKNRKELDNLRLYERNVQQLCAAIHEVVDITIYDTAFTPREYLREKLLEVLRRFVKKAVIIDEQNHLVQRPSVLVRCPSCEMLAKRYAEV